MRLPRAVALLVVTGIAVSGCTSADDKPKEPSAGVPPTASATTATPTPTPTPTPTDQAPSVAEQLLSTEMVPGLNSKWHWQDGRTGAGGTDPFGVCAKADLGSIGAVEVLERSYFPPDDSDDSAAQQIADFADAKSANQAWAVLDAWRSKCAAKLGAKLTPKVSTFTAIPLATGDPARWYLVSWTPAGEETGRFEAIGMIRHGSRISVLRMTNSGMDYNYPVGKEPMVTMVKRAMPGVGS